MKVALITDTHFGCRNDNIVFANHMKKFYHEFFFPYLDEHNIKSLIHLGDLVDRRKQINYITARNLEEDFMRPIHERGLNAHFIVGNHDSYYKNTIMVNSLNELYSKSEYQFNLVMEPQEVEIDGTKLFMIPWICADNEEKTFELMEKSKAKYAFGHLEVQGFEMYRGSVNHHGLQTNVFGKFDRVFSGHFHHKSTRDNLTYLGAPYEMTWADYNDWRGFHIFDTETGEIEGVRTPYRLFHKIIYDDSKPTKHEYELYEGCFVKVIVRKKKDPVAFDIFLDKLYRSGAHDVAVVDDHMNIDQAEDSDLVDEAEDTMSILKNYIKGTETIHQKELEHLMSDLYQEALSLE